MSYLNKAIIKFKGLFPTKLKTSIKKFKKFNGYNELDKKMLEFINFKNGFYVDCGANDGVNQSTTWYFENQLDWKGILIEPIPSVFNELKKNRNKNNYFQNCALTNSSFEKDYVDFFYNEKDTLTGAIKNKNNTLKINVIAKTFNKIIDEINYKGKIDFFSLDVEGNEFEVLDGIDFKKHYIDYMLIETNNFSKLENFFSTLNYKFLKRLSNYKFLDKPEYGDYLFKKMK